MLVELGLEPGKAADCGPIAPVGARTALPPMLIPDTAVWPDRANRRGPRDLDEP